MYHSCTELDQYPISTVLHNHMHTSLNSSTTNQMLLGDPWLFLANPVPFWQFEYWLIILHKSPPTAQTLVVVPQCWEWCLCNLNASITFNALNRRLQGNILCGAQMVLNLNLYKGSFLPKSRNIRVATKLLSTISILYVTAAACGPECSGK